MLIRVGAAALNFNDIDRCRGKLVSVTKDPPFTLGMDVCGVVDAAGAGAEHWIGQRVVAISKDALGGIAEHAVAPAGGRVRRARRRSTTSRRRRSCSRSTPPTSRCSTGRSSQAGETLLVHSGASGLGTAAIQLGVAAGARVFATVSSPEKAALCTRARRRAGDRPHRPRTSSRRCSAPPTTSAPTSICDLAGGDFVPRSWQCVARDGRYLPVGFTDDDENGMTGRPLRMASIGNFSIVGVLCAWVDDLDPGHAPVRVQPVHPRRRRPGARRPAAPDRRRVASAPTSAGWSRMDEAGAALDDHEHRRSIGRTVVEIADALTGVDGSWPFTPCSPARNPAETMTT